MEMKNIKKNNDIKTNEFLFNYNNDIINESDLEMYKKLDILRNESKNNLENNPQNEELKFNFSDESELV